MPDKTSHRKKTGKTVLIFFSGLVLLFVVYFFSVSVEHPPEVEDLSPVKIRREKAGDNLFFLGNNWLRKSESGLWEMYIEGDPFERGVGFRQADRRTVVLSGDSIRRTDSGTRSFTGVFKISEIFHCMV